jgi:hypothetical protein
MRLPRPAPGARQAGPLGLLMPWRVRSGIWSMESRCQYTGDDGWWRDTRKARGTREGACGISFLCFGLLMLLAAILGLYDYRPRLVIQAQCRRRYQLRHQEFNPLALTPSYRSDAKVSGCNKAKSRSAVGRCAGWYSMSLEWRSICFAMYSGVNDSNEQEGVQRCCFGDNQITNDIIPAGHARSCRAARHETGGQSSAVPKTRSDSACWR